MAARPLCALLLALSASPALAAADDGADLRERLGRLEAEVARLREALAGQKPPAVPAEAPPPAVPVEVPALQPTLLGELDLRVYPAESEGNSGFALARLRPGLQLRPLPWFTAVATLEFANEHPSVLDAYLRLRAADWASVTLGYSKPPLFASFIHEPVHTLPFPDRAPVVLAFRVRRDLGADVHFAPRSVPIEAWLRVGNGTGSALGNDNPLPAGYANLDLVLGRARRGARQDRLGLRLGAGALVEGARDRDGIAGQTPLGFVYYRPNVVSGLRVVAEGHAVAYAGPLRLTVEGALAREARSRDDDGNPDTPRQDLEPALSFGLTAELAWVLRGRPREVGAAPKGERGAFRGGVLEVAARYDGLWLGRGAPDVASGGSHGGGVALKWWPVPFLAATAAGYLTRYDTAPIERPGEVWSYGVLVRASFFWGYR